MKLLRIAYVGPGLGGKRTSIGYLASTSNTDGELPLDKRPRCAERLRYHLSIGGRAYLLDLFAVVRRVWLWEPDGDPIADAELRELSYAHGVVLVCDSQRVALDRNRFYLQRHRDDLGKVGRTNIPTVFQLNKQDARDLATTEEIVESLGCDRSMVVPASAARGAGVEEVLRVLVRTIEESEHLGTEASGVIGS